MKLIFSVLLQLACVSLLAQKLEVRNREFSFSLGAVETQMEKFSINEDIDFLNYYDTNPGNFDYIVVIMGYRFDYLSKMSADIKLIVMSDLLPDNYDISTYYHFNKSVGIGIGSSLNKFYISYFEQFQLQSLPDYYLVDENSQQFKVYDLCFYLSPIFKPIRSERFQATVKIDIGLSSFLKEKAVFYHKRKLSNERLTYHYNTKITYQPYVNPKIEMRLRAFSINKTSVGLLLMSNFYYSQRTMNYQRSIQKWTSGDAINDLVKPPKHRYTRFETDIGFYMNW